MSEQSSMRMSAEQPQVQVMVQHEPVNNGVLVDTDTPEHRAAVVKIVNFALGWVDERFTLSERLQTSRVLITQMREKSPGNAKSILLRDSERYLWGRTYVPVKVAGGQKPETARIEAEFADSFYQTFVKAPSMAVNGLFGTSWGKSNPSLPFSPLGGGDWYDLGLYHYDQLDEDHLKEVVEPHRVTVAEVAAYFHLLNGRIFD
jgi:hypothetical protein